MKLIEYNFQRLLYSQNWNIGFSTQSPENVLNGNKLKIKWLKHPYKDRFFADPFILKLCDKEIEILAEELIFISNKAMIKHPKGTIVKLRIDRKKTRLIERVEVLNLSDHLSFPNIIKLDREIYVYPENCNSGKLNLYKYDNVQEKLIFEKTLINEPLIDACIFFHKNLYWITATKKEFSQRDLHLFYSNDLFGPYLSVKFNPVLSDNRIARPAGNVFSIHGHFYRPAQDCSKSYGGGIIIQEIKKLDHTALLLNDTRKIYPTSFKYHLGIHTINFGNDLCVVDGVGYLFPIYGYIYNYLIILKKIFKL